MTQHRIEADSHVPIYAQIIEYLRSAIAAGVYRPGEALPSLRVLAIQLKVNPNTVQRAYDEMDRLGMIKARRGVGMFVSDRGAQSALGSAEQSIQSAFEDAIALARSASLSNQRIRDLFQEAMHRSGNSGRTRAGKTT